MCQQPRQQQCDSTPLLPSTPPHLRLPALSLWMQEAGNMHPLSLWGPGGGADCSAPPSPAGLVGHPAFTPPTFSIKQQFAGAHVLLTGASGYIGSVILEQLLRTTEVASIR